MQVQPRESACHSPGASRSVRPSWLYLPACMMWLPLVVLPGGKVIPERRAHARLDSPTRIARPAAFPGVTNGTPARMDVDAIQDLVDDLRARLPIPEEVTVKIVPRNALVASVERVGDRNGAFLLSIEGGFLDLLDGDDLRAVIAHELGHVWIFTHHPYLHTEPLANRIAMRLVSRESLEQVYAKVWQRGGAKGDLARFLGE